MDFYIFMHLYIVKEQIQLEGEFGIEDIKKFIEKYEKLGKWRFAKTYAKTSPHEYLMFFDVEKEDRQNFREFIKFIIENGYTIDYKRIKITYLNVEEFKYWVMGDPERAKLINRDRLRQVKKYWKEKYPEYYEG